MSINAITTTVQVKDPVKVDVPLTLVAQQLGQSGDACALYRFLQQLGNHIDQSASALSHTSFEPTFRRLAADLKQAADNFRKSCEFEV